MRVSTFTISTPPSANAVSFNAPGKGRVKSVEYRRWREREAWNIKSQGAVLHENNVIVLIGVRRNSKLMSSDVDNRIKPTLDLLKLAGVIVDDKFVTFVAAAWYPPGKPEAVVTVYDATPGEFSFHVDLPPVNVETMAFASDCRPAKTQEVRA